MADTTRKKPIDAEDVPAPAAAAVDDKPSASANAAKPARQTAKPAADAAPDMPEENPTADPKTEASVEKTEAKADPSVNKVAEPAPAAEVAPEDEKKVATGASSAADADQADAPVAPAKDVPEDAAPADEGESLEQRLVEAEARAAEAERKLAVAQVGFELGLPPELASRLQGTTEAEIKKDAKALIDAIAKFKATQPADDAEDDQDDAEEDTPLDRNGRVPARGRKSNTDSATMDAIGARMFRR